MRVNELMLYRHMEQGQVLNDMAFLMENYDNEYYNKEDLRGLLFDSVNEILELAVSHGQVPFILRDSGSGMFV